MSFDAAALNSMTANFAEEDEDTAFEDDGPKAAAPAAPVKTMSRSVADALNDMQIDITGGDETLEISNRLRENVDPMTLFAAFYMKRSSQATCPVFESGATVADFLNFCCSLTGLKAGVPNLRKINFNPDLAKARELQKYTQSAIAFALSEKRAPEKHYLTSLSLAPFIAKHSPVGYSFGKAEDGALQQTLEIDGMPPVKFQRTKYGLDRPIAGAAEFIADYNKKYGMEIEYLELSPGTEQFSMLMSAQFSIAQNEKKEYVLTPLPAPPPAYGKYALTKAEEKVGALFAEQFNKAMVSGMKLPPLPHQKNPRFAMDILVYKTLECQKIHQFAENMGVQAGNKQAKVQKAVDDLVACASDFKSATFPQAKAIDGKIVSGSIADFRKVNETARKSRKQTDLKKKDSVNESGLAMSATSVPYKTAVMLDKIGGVGLNLRSLKARAFGIGSHNYWAAELNTAFKSVEYYDVGSRVGKDILGGGKSLEGDIFKLPLNSGHGYVLCDDSYDKAKDNYGKLESIANAHYEAGFTKLMYGEGVDAKVPLSSTNDAIKAFKKCYEYVDFVRFSPHSLEYFLVFAHSKKVFPLVAWDKPLVPGEGASITEREWEVRFNTWHKLRGMEIYSANIARTYAAYSGIPGLGIAPLFSRMDPVVPERTIRLGGTVVPGRLKDLDKKAAFVEPEAGDDVAF